MINSGMSITSALMSYLIATKKARVGLNGPEVIEQEAGVREFDSSDKDLIWNTLGYPNVFQIKSLSLESNSRTPASCSITSGPFKPTRAFFVAIK